ncbi:MAG: hypothetical protein ACRDRU_22480 [Pseudonocardiaceae bacterium]
MTREPHPDSLGVPANWMCVTTRLPAHCVRHGLPAARRVDLALQSRPQLANNLPTRGNVLGLGSRLGEWGQRVKVTRVRGWPLCSRCVTQRRTWIWPTWVLFWGGLALVVGAVTARIVAGPAPLLGIPLLGGCAMMLASVVPFTRASYLRITQAQTSVDGSQVIIANPHPRFVSEMHELINNTSHQSRFAE